MHVTHASFCAVDNTLNGEGLNNADNDPGCMEDEEHDDGDD